MAGRVNVEIFKLWVFTEIVSLCVGQNTNMKNVALNKACNISSRYQDSPSSITGNCSTAINGNTTTVLVLDRNRATCINTKNEDTSPFWWVDLGQRYTINKMTIYGRTTWLSRMVCVNVSLDGIVIKRFNDTSGWTSDKYDMKVGRCGKVINITRDCKSPEPVINLCQVQVWACDDGWYGDNCTQSCGRCAGDPVCDKVNGSCTSCQTGFQLPMCTECEDGWYGKNCTEMCGHCEGGNSTCNKTSGSCPSCDGPYQPPLCKDNCKDGRYGKNCNETCGQCVGGNSTCDKTSGGCPSCDGAFQPPLCKDKCFGGYYGNNCSQPCGHCRMNTTCDADNGTCPSGCSEGYNEALCNECKDGWYGKSCNETCGHCVGGNSTCDKSSGNCPSCDGPFQPPLCKDNCEDGWYGKNCNQTCGSCEKGSSTCDKTSGDCPSCDGAFQPPLCQDKCNGGWFGKNCNETCGHCAGGNSTCDKTSGSCPSCDGPFQPPLCIDKCSSGFYGENCKQPCGRCLNTTCDPDNGTCPLGCIEGYKTDLCNDPIMASQNEPSSVPIAIIVGPVFAVTVAVVVVVIVIVWLRRRPNTKRHQSRLTKEENDKREDAVVSEQMTNLSRGKENKVVVLVRPQTNDQHVYSNLHEDITNMGSSTSERTSANTENCSDKNITALEPITTKVRKENKIYENVVLKTKTDESQTKMSSTKADNKNREDVNPAHEEGKSNYNTDDIYASYRSLGPSLILDDFQESLLASLASGKLRMEFAAFSKDMEHPHEVGLKPENLKKNRFKALCAYDHSRVVLCRPKGDIDTDYINASYIKGCQPEKAYIATQGPRSNTVDDLWWMVWQENATQIIMLTNLKDGGKDKCEEYWPSVGTTKTYGHVTVTALKTDSRADFVIRYFVLGSKQGGDQRTVSQYHYMVWPDHGVPSTCSLVNFWRYVKARAQGAVPIVHCSAGVGRTGTYIALDIASDLRSHHRNVNVKDIVSRLREDRTLMVQNEEQYKFLHEVILEEHTSRATRMTFDQFDLVFPDTIDGHKSRIDKEFKVLKLFGQFVPKPRPKVAESKENLPKNRNTESLPEDSHLVYLMDRVPGRNQYINAVHMSSFKKIQGLILTQLPLPDTVVDMWRLIDGWDVKTIVSLGHKDQSQLVENYCSYWPETEKGVLKTGPHTITLMSTSRLGKHITCAHLSLATKASAPREVRVLSYDDWGGVVPGNIADLLYLMDILESWHVEEDTSPVIVQCSDGMTRSGMFCVLHEVIKRAMHDQEIDVYLSVRHVQSVRPQAITTEAQYRYCYKAAQEYKSQQSVYQNT